MAREFVFLLHGFASSANSTKARFFRERFKSAPHIAFHALDFNPTRRDFEYMTITGMINRLRQVVLDSQTPTVSVIGSSMGALVGLHYAHRYGGVKRLLLLAPALSHTDLFTADEMDRWRQAGFIDLSHYAFESDVPLRYDFHVDAYPYRHRVPPRCPTLIVHGKRDDVIPIESSRQYASAYPGLVVLDEVESDHRLNDKLDRIWTHVREYLIEAG